MVNKLKSVTVSQTPGEKYYASVLFEYENQVQEHPLQKFLGLDFSMHGLYKDSDGNEPCYPRYYRQAEKRLKREQRKLSKMQKSSNNSNKQRIKVAKMHEKVANQRKDFLHKQSRKIINSYDCVCIMHGVSCEDIRAASSRMEYLLKYCRQYKQKGVHLDAAIF